MSEGWVGSPGAVSRARAALRPVIAPQEFKSAEDLRRHYAAVRERLSTAIKPWSPPEVVEITRDVKETEVVVGRLFDLMRRISLKHGVAIVAMKGERRTKAIVTARKEFYYLARVETLSSYNQIATMVNRDHTTVIAGAKAYAIEHGLPCVILDGRRKA